MQVLSDDIRTITQLPKVGMIQQPESAPLPGNCYPQVDAKFLTLRGKRFYIRGTSYGSFAPDPVSGAPFPLPNVVWRDFALMRSIGINTVRLYDLPPMWLLDTALESGIYIILGIPWAQHLCLDQTGRREVIQQVYAASRTYAQHPAVLMCCVGNEIPSQIVRWYGKKQTEHFIGDMCAAAHDATPGLLTTYANYPTTEYLELPCLDVVGFNVYLHEQRSFQKYLAHLHVIAGDRPLFLTELGMDSLRHGQEEQAAFFRTQLRDAFDHGLCGAITFSWTDDWFRGGEQITDWAFGLVDQVREPKPAYYAVGDLLSQTPFTRARHWPRVSVVISAYNAAMTLDDCLSSLTQLTYPDYEVIVVNDGSSDQTGVIADRYAARDGRIRVLHRPNGGLSVARNAGLAAAIGEIVAYADADCRVDPDWLYYLSLALMDKPITGVGGPNLVPPDDDWVAQCVARAPGGPHHIPLNDEIAEHIPGCNMAFWRTALQEIGGFHPDFDAAGDDVDICWRLQAQGHQLGFAPSAIVWHHRRSSVRAYLKQQVGYGRSEAILEDHHPEKFNELGQVRWFGGIYGPANLLPLRRRYRIYYGRFGLEPFQALEHIAPNWWFYLPQMPEWYLLMLLLGIAALYMPWLGIGIVMACSLTLLSVARASRAAILPKSLTRSEQLRYRGLIALLHLLQPLARTWGRLKGGLGPLRLPTRAGARKVPERASWRHLNSVLWRWGSFEVAYWAESGVDQESFLNRVMVDLYRRRLNVSTGSGWEPSDLLLQGYSGERAYVDSTVEYHGGPKCLLRLRNRLRTSRRMIYAGFVLLLLAAGAVMPDSGGTSFWELVEEVDEVTEGATIFLPFFWFAWLGVGRIRLATEILAAVERVAQEMQLIPLRRT
jgi:O-antigen biosynthesis protein